MTNPPDRLSAGQRTPTPARAALLFLLCAVIGVAVATPAAAQRPRYALDTLAVEVGSRAATAGSRARAIEVITAETLRTLPVRSLAGALEWALSVDVQPRSPAQADVSIRGGSFEQVLVLVDGVRMSDPQTGHFDLDLAVPFDRIERIEILRGGASAIYGADAFGGVINVVTRDGSTDPSATLRLEGGSFGELSGGLDGSIGHGEWTVAGGASHDRADGHREGTDYRITRATGRIAGPFAGGRVRLSGGWAAHDFGAADFYAAFPSYEETRTRTASARWDGGVSDRLSLTLQAAHRRHDDDFVLRRGDPGFYRNLHDSRQTQFEASLNVDLSGANTLVLGAETADEEIESTNLGDRAQRRNAAFAELALRSGRLSGQLGARIDEREELDRTFLSPSVSLGWVANDRVRLRAAAARAFRAPTWTERYYEDPANLGSPDLDPETGWTVEAGADVAVGDGVLAATVFRRTTNDLIDWARRADDPGARWETRNVESATFTGVELQASGLAVGPVELRAALSLLDLETEEAPGFFSKSSLRPLTRTVTLGAGTGLPGEARLETLLEHRRRDSGESGEFLDLRLAVPVGAATLRLDATNLLDDRMLDLTGFPVAGRAFRVGLTTRLGGAR